MRPAFAFRSIKAIDGVCAWPRGHNAMPAQKRAKWRRTVLVPIIGGAILTLIGSALLADQLGYVLPYRWVFLLLLVPAAAALADGIRTAGAFGWRNVHAMARIIAGVLFAAIGMLMFFELNTGVILPALIMILGAGTVARAFLNRV